MDKIMDNMGIFDYVETPEGTYEYTASEISDQFAGIVKNGVVKGVGDQFDASVVGLQITIGTGEAWLLGHHGEMIGETILTSDPVAAGMQKICSVVLDVDITNQQMGITFVVGTQAESPSAPQLIQTEARYQQEIWQALVHDDGTITLDDKRVFIARLGDLPTPDDIGAAELDSNGKVATDQDSLIIIVKDTSWTLVLTDADHKMFQIETNDITVTVPLNATVNVPVGVIIPFTCPVSGSLTFAADTGVTILSVGGNMTIAEHPSAACLMQLTTDTWLLTGCDS